MTQPDAKAWLAKEISLLERQCDAGWPPLYTCGDTPPEIYNIANVVLENYEQRAFAYIRDNPSTALLFLVAHTKLSSEFDFGDHQEMARIINGQRLRAKQLDRGTYSKPYTSRTLLPTVSPPSSGSSTVCSIDAWVDDVNLAGGNRSPRDEPRYGGGPCETTDIRNCDDCASPLQPAGPIPQNQDGTAKPNNRTLPDQHTQRTWYPRVAKAVRVKPELPAAAHKGSRTPGDGELAATILVRGQIGGRKRQKRDTEMREPKRRKT